ncbi:MAG: ankyrin repeat domain-containing protein [Deltaproteobacteria bacterium]|nr:ankyrin repeat domain-containing protein [Deltaproteobacteria bacterium]
MMKHITVFLISVIILAVLYHFYHKDQPLTYTLSGRIQQSIKKGENLNALVKESANYYSFLHQAALDGDLNALKLLVENNVDVNVRDRIDATPLHRAVQKGEIAFARLLLENGADVEAKSNSRATPLEFAVGAEDYSVDSVNLLISYSADVNATDNEGDTPLHRAAFYGNDKIAEILIENGADINKQGWSGRTPLHVAAQYGNPAVAKILLEHGADKHIRDKTGNDSLDVALMRANPDHESKSGKKKVADLLVKQKTSK